MREDIIDSKLNGEVTINIAKAISPAFYPIWFTNVPGVRYRILVGGRNTGKSKTIIGYESIMKIVSNPKRNILVFRKNDVDNRDSTFRNIVNCIDDLGFTKYFSITKVPLEITYKPTGQRIVFKGSNNPTSITSVEGFSDIIIEECSEFDDFSAFRILDGSIRKGKLMGDDINPQITCCLNGWSDEHWTYKEFFKDRLEFNEEELLEKGYQFYCDLNYKGPFGKGLALHRSCYLANSFRDAENYDPSMEELRIKAPKIWEVEAMGNFGQSTMGVYPEFNESCLVDIQEIMQTRFIDFAIGIDTGYSDGAGHRLKVKKGEDPNLKIRSATTMQLVGISSNNTIDSSGQTCSSKIFCIDEFFHSNDRSINITNTDNRDDMTFPQLVSSIIDTLAQWMQKYAGHTRNSCLMVGKIPVFIDNADIPSRQAFEAEALKKGLYNVEFFGSTKLSIQSRIDFDRVMMAYGDFKVCKQNCPNLIREYKSARRGENGEAREPGNDHALDAQSYALSVMRNNLMRWKNFKQH